jgi:hypothetical protein
MERATEPQVGLDSTMDKSNSPTFAKQEQPNVVDWHGNDDAANPRNFASWKKTINIGCIFFMCFVS